MPEENVKKRAKKEVTMDLYLTLREELRCYLCKKLPRPGDEVLRCPKESRSVCEKCHVLSICCAQDSTENPIVPFQLSHPRLFNGPPSQVQGQATPEHAITMYDDEECGKMVKLPGDLSYEEDRLNHQKPRISQDTFNFKRPVFTFGVPPALNGNVNFVKMKHSVGHKPCSLIAKLMQELPFECINVRKGCQEVLCKEEIAQHEKICSYRWINCADLECKDSDVCFINFAQHFNDKHKDCQEFQGTEMFLQDSITFLSFSNGCKFKPKKILAFDQIFFLVGVIRMDIVYYWVYLLGSEAEAKNYYYKMKLSNNGCRKELVFKGQVHSMNEFSEDIIKGELDTFVFTTKAAEQFQTKNGCIQYNLKLESLAGAKVPEIA